MRIYDLILLFSDANMAHEMFNTKFELFHEREVCRLS
jgi:hypothetical protein